LFLPNYTITFGPWMPKMWSLNLTTVTTATAAGRYKELLTSKFIRGLLEQLSIVPKLHHDMLKNVDIDKLSLHAAGAFCNHEPLTCLLLNHPKWARHNLCKEIVGEGISFVTWKESCEHWCEDGGCCGETLGFSSLNLLNVIPNILHK
jgi:hypothetical protein